ncbi:hypothetical protein DCAR_0101670 [Daucus carota subsp. sativus]|uniref:Uncharacterized protein n=1 Tax=Daucus carota subsp. sativus TaxID=79200 RepID=A0AAF0W3F2_DAUCS|nr:hypothetical protein DCAR_0101670 [Daucus carota subsp. sativus]
MLKKYNSDSKHVIEYEPVELEADLSYVEMPVEILDRKEKVLRNKVVKLARVLWRNPKEVEGELDDTSMFVVTPGTCTYLQILAEVRESNESIQRKLAGDGEFLRSITVDSGRFW